MLLSTLTLKQLDNLESQSKRDRICSFIREQKQHLPYYTHAVDDIQSTASSRYYDCRNNEDGENDNLSDFTASISELIRRKYEAEEEDETKTQERSVLNREVDNTTLKKLSQNVTASLTPAYKKDKRPKLASPTILSSSVMTGKSVQTSHPVTGNNQENNSTNQLPLTKANGFRLLEKFVSPNLEMNRITMKQHHNHRKKPKIGLFNKGKSSANGYSVPELVFSENKFLKRKHHVASRNSLSSTATVVNTGHNAAKSIAKESKRTPSISKFFSNVNNSHADETHRVSLSTGHSNTTFRTCRKTVQGKGSQANTKEALSTTATRGFGHMTADSATVTSRNISPMQGCPSYRLLHVHGLLAQNANVIRKDTKKRGVRRSNVQINHRQQQRLHEQQQNNHKAMERDASRSSTASVSSSNESIKQLLKECQESILSFCPPSSSHNPNPMHNKYPPFEQQPINSSRQTAPMAQQPMPTYAAPRSCYYPSPTFTSEERALLSSSSTLRLPNSHAHRPIDYYNSNYDNYGQQQQPTPSTLQGAIPSKNTFSHSYYYESANATTKTVDRDPSFVVKGTLHHNNENTLMANISNSSNSGVDHSFSSPIHETRQQPQATAKNDNKWHGTDVDYVQEYAETAAMINDDDDSSSSNVSLVYLGSMTAYANENSIKKANSNEEEEEEELNLPNFWLEQSYRRKL